MFFKQEKTVLDTMAFIFYIVKTQKFETSEGMILKKKNYYRNLLFDEIFFI